MGLIGQASDAVQRHVGGPRASVLLTRRMAGADYMAGPVLGLGPRTEERGSRHQISVMESTLRTSLKKRRENAAKGREIRKELRQMERELIAGGLLDKHWQGQFF